MWGTSRFVALVGACRAFCAYVSRTQTALERELLRGQGDGAEGRVDRAGPDSGDCGVGVEEVGHDVEFGLRMRAVEVASVDRLFDLLVWRSL